MMRLPRWRRMSNSVTSTYSIAMAAPVVFSVKCGDADLVYVQFVIGAINHDLGCGIPVVTRPSITPG